jgi:predicted peptidase
MHSKTRCLACPEFGVWWCYPPKGTMGPPWRTIVFLHGFGERGDSSLEMLAKIGRGGLPGEVERSENQLLQDPELFPFLVVAPQAASHWEQEQDQVEGLVQRLTESGFVRGRPFLTGFSIGGDGAWVVAARQPSVFAAVAPVASEDPEGAQGIGRVLARVPIWIGYHNDDQYTARRRPSAVIDALSEAGNSKVEVREYVGPTPDGWSPHGYVARQAYTDPHFYAWLRDRA